MILTDKQIELIRESYRDLETGIEETSVAFYEELFRRDPELQSLFRDDLAGQGMRFMSAVRAIADNLDDPDRMNETVNRLAQGHAQFGISERSYRAMEEALIITFADKLKVRFDKPVEHAWRSAFRQVCDQMINLGKSRD